MKNSCLTRDQPEDDSCGGLGPVVLCNPPLSRWSAKELGSSELSACGSASLFKVKHCGLWFLLRPLCGPPTHTGVAVETFV